MRRIPVALAALSLASVALVGCSSASDPAASCARATDAGTSLAGLVSVSGTFGQRPTVHVPSPFHTTTTQFFDAQRGDGTIPITGGDQAVSMDLTVVDGTTGKTVMDTRDQGQVGGLYMLSSVEQAMPGLRDALHCATTGTRVVAALSPKGVESQFAQSVNVQPTDSLVAVVDLHEVFRGAADGSLVYNDGWGMPSVVRAPDGRPGVVVPDGAAPTDFRMQVLKRGTGKKVTTEDRVLMNYTIVNWDDKSVATTTWGQQPDLIDPATKSKGFAKAVEGQTVGSQVMAIIPKKLGASDAAGTQIAVIDILGTIPIPAK